MLKKLRGLWKEEEGQGMAEYGIVLGVIAIAVVATLVTLRTQIMELFQDALNALTNANANNQ